MTQVASAKLNDIFQQMGRELIRRLSTVTTTNARILVRASGGDVQVARELITSQYLMRVYLGGRNDHHITASGLPLDGIELAEMSERDALARKRTPTPAKGSAESDRAILLRALKAAMGCIQDMSADGLLAIQQEAYNRGWEECAAAAADFVSGELPPDTYLADGEMDHVD